MRDLVPKVAPTSRAEIEKYALDISRKHYPHLVDYPGAFPVLDFFDHVLVDEYGLDTGVEELSPGVEGITWPDGRVILDEVTYRNAMHDDGRARFTVAHECFHGLRHRKQIRKSLVDTGGVVLHRRFDIKPFEDPEWQADTFAGALLLPEEMVRYALTGSHRLHRCERLMETFGVSAKAAEVRLQKLRIDFVR